jgi:SAM-dependent methyltransferase
VAEVKCVVCGGTTLHSIEPYTSLRRVTSDCKPWPAGGYLLYCSDCGTVQKRLDDHWLGEIDAIYNAYTLFELAGGSEQLIFGGGEEPLPRSKLLVNYLTRSQSLPVSGRLLDIGCGTGAALKNFSEALPTWQLYGSELSDRSLPQLRQIPNFTNLYTSNIEEIPIKFDVITLIHTLEHFVDPAKMISAARHLLSPGGIIFVQVPDLETSPFDLLVADHRTHFTKPTLSALIAQAGITTISLSNSILPKEITAIGKLGSAAPLPINVSSEISLGKTTVDWLQGVRNLGEELAARNPGLGIFGTSISGIWCYSEIKDGVRFFVDEDPSKIGHSYDGRPIYAPDKIASPNRVYVPLSTDIAEKVVARLGDQFIPPPRLILN